MTKRKQAKAGYVEYRSNNSGGSWWLTDDHWRALEAAGWQVEWMWMSPDYGKDGNHTYDLETGLPKLIHNRDSDSKFSSLWVTEEGGRFLGALATTAHRSGLSLRDAAAEWESITGLSSTDAGCACCGQPHSFTEYDAFGKYVASGPDAEYVASW